MKVAPAPHIFAKCSTRSSKTNAKPRLSCTNDRRAFLCGQFRDRKAQSQK
jgi:hypothetical protein